MMKKSQILAAIALAMALGVVAPVSSASAKVSDLDASQASSVSKSIDETVNKLVEAADKIGTSVDENITSVATGKKVGLRASEQALYNGVTALTGAVAYQEGQEVSGLMTALQGIATDSAKAAYKALGATPTYAAVTSAINGEITAQKAIVNNTNASEAQRQAADGIINTLEAALKTAQDNIVNNAINGSDGNANGTNDIDDVIAALGVFMNTDGFKKEAADATDYAGKYSPATYQSILAGVNKVPKYSLFATLFGAEAEAQKALSTDASSVTYAEALEAIANLEAAIKAFGVSTPETPDLPSKDDATNGAGAPNTGVVGTAEGTATTVSIVAGLATALTALGAGVVAYRSARRK